LVSFSRKIMNIKINKAKKDTFWYAEYIGEIFEVTGRTRRDYSVRHMNKEKAYLVDRDDCEVVRARKKTLDFGRG